MTTLSALGASPSPRFSGVMLKASLSPGHDKPHMTAYFFDTQRICPTLNDGVVLAQPLDRSKLPIVLEDDNEIVRFTTDSLRRNDHFSRRTTWPWPNDQRMLYDEFMERLRHAKGWLTHLGGGFGNEQPAFQTLYDNHRPRVAQMSLTEIIAETTGYRESWNSGEVEFIRRRPLIDDNWQGLLGHAAEMLGPEHPLLPSRPPAIPTVLTPEIMGSTQNRKRITLPQPMIEWLKNPRHLDVINWAMSTDGYQLYQWLRPDSHYGLFKRFMQLAQLASNEADRPLKNNTVHLPNQAATVDTAERKIAYLPEPLVTWLNAGTTPPGGDETGAGNVIITQQQHIVRWLMHPKVEQRVRWMMAHRDWEIPQRMQLAAAIEASAKQTPSTGVAVNGQRG